MISAFILWHNSLIHFWFSKFFKIENLKGFAVVSNVYKAKSNAEVEKMFFNKPFCIFSELNEAVAWANELVNQ